MNIAVARMAMLSGDPVSCNGRVFRITALIQRADNKSAPPRLQAFAEIEDYGSGRLVFDEESEVITGAKSDKPLERAFALEIPIEFLNNGGN